MAAHTVLVTGATGFVGSNLIPVLERAGFEVCAASRDPDRARQRFPDRRFRRLDLSAPSSIPAALAGCDAAVYLVHGMAADDGDYETNERRMASEFLRAAERAGLQRIVYLGGIRPRGTPSKHLRSRLATGEILRSGTIPTVELQASMIIGSGSESWRIVRNLALRLPWMLLPSWLRCRTQPVAIDDVTYAIAEALALELDQDARLVEALPGPEILTGRAILERIAALRGMRPRVLELPLVTPRLSSYWIALVTRADSRIARELVEGLTSDLLAADEGAPAGSGQALQPESPGVKPFWRRCPGHRRQGFDAAARQALARGQDELSIAARILEAAIRAIARRDPPRGAAHANVRARTPRKSAIAPTHARGRVR